MSSKPSQMVYEAILSGNTVEAAKLIDEVGNKSKAAARPKENIINFNTILNDDDASAVKVYDFMNKEFKDWWEWETETIDHMLWIKFGVALEDVNRDKLLAIRHLCRSDQAFFDWFEFNQLALSFAGCIADFEMLRKPSPGMIINTVRAMNHIRPERNSNFGNDVVKFICIILIDSGLYCPPKSIAGIVKKAFSELVSEETLSLWPAIYKKYEEIVSKKNIEITETVTDIQARRMMSAEASALSYGQ